ELNATGAGKLTAGENLVVEFNAEVEDVPANGSISNTAWALPTAPVGLAADWDPEAAGARPGTVSNTTVSKYGQINITKTDTSDAAANLAGATFELHRCTTTAEGAVTKVENTGPIEVGGQTEFPTTENGGAYTATISGIHLGNVMPNADGTDVYQDVWAGEAGTTGTTFCLVETLAPDGYSVLPQPVAVELTATADTTELVTANQTIENVKANAGATLPLTGGIGIWLLVGGSLLALIAGIYWDQKQRARRA
ncbi:SpaH/EbpB family LPXTG-anchored major pilin, partial [Corynebacterium sp.]|uniref:SpaH/EbpB family LPXTG-anchored major pilin n=1 Tax=Corynebacterium sp. TaxID=1720 RepID=UPI0026DEDDB4